MFIQIADIVLYFNKSKKSDFEFQSIDEIKLFFSSKLTSCLSKSRLNKGIRLSYYNPNKEELGVIVSLQCFGIFNTILNYRLSIKKITMLLNRYKNSIITAEVGKYLCVIAVKNYSKIGETKLISFLEKKYSKIYESEYDNFYDINVNIGELISSISNSLKEYEDFLKCKRTTKFHDIDIKLWEIQIAIACGCTITSIVMLGVTLEECCKIVLKSDLERELNSSQNQSINSFAEASLKAEKKYGRKNLGMLIKYLLDKEFINREESIQLKNIKNYVRNAFIHSDKSKMFEDKKGKVTVLKLSDSNRIHIRTEQFSPLEMSFALGIMQKDMANKNVKIIFYEIEEYIHRITKRFWDKQKVGNN